MFFVDHFDFTTQPYTISIYLVFGTVYSIPHMHREWIFLDENYFEFNLLCPEESHCTWLRTVLIPFNILSALFKLKTSLLRDYLRISFTELVSTNDSSFNEQKIEKKVEKCKNNSNFNDISSLYMDSMNSMKCKQRWFWQIAKISSICPYSHFSNLLILLVLRRCHCKCAVMQRRPFEHDDSQFHSLNRSIHHCKYWE